MSRKNIPILHTQNSSRIALTTKKNRSIIKQNVAIEKDTASISKADLLTTSAPENDRIFITTILQNALAVKYNQMITDSGNGSEIENGLKSKWSDLQDGARIKVGVMTERSALNQVVFSAIGIVIDSYSKLQTV